MLNDKTQEVDEVKDIEVVTPSESSTEDENQDDEFIKEETPEESSDQDPEVKETEEVILKEPKPVDGETPREHALRLEVERLKGLRRQERKEDLNQVETKIEKIEKKDVLSKYDQTELANLKEVLGVFADEFGFVRKNELQTSTYQQTSDFILDDFLQSHPEYLPENDKDNILWDRFKQEYSIYKQPENAKDVKKILERVQSTISGGKSVNIAAINAQQAKIKQAAHGGTTIGKSSHSRTQLDPKIKSGLKGFTEEEMNELFT